MVLEEYYVEVEAVRLYYQIMNMGRCGVYNLVGPFDTDCFCGIPLAPVDMNTGKFMIDNGAVDDGDDGTEELELDSSADEEEKVALNDVKMRLQITHPLPTNCLLFLNISIV